MKAKLNQCKLAVVSMSTPVLLLVLEIIFGVLSHSARTYLKTVKTLAQTSECLAQVCFLATSSTSAMSVNTAEMNTSRNAVSDVANAGCPSTTFIGDVILHARIRIDQELLLLDRSSETRVVLSCVLIVGIVLWVINVLLRAVDSQSLLGDLEFSGGITKGQEAQNPNLDGG